MNRNFAVIKGVRSTNVHFVCVFSRFSAAVPPRSGAAPGELMAGGADDRAHLEIHPLPRQTHLRTGPYSGQVARSTVLTF